MSDLRKYNPTLLDRANTAIDPSQYKRGSFGRFGANLAQNVMDLLGVSDASYVPNNSGFGIMEATANPSRYYIPEWDREALKDEQSRNMNTMMMNSIDVPEAKAVKGLVNSVANVMDHGTLNIPLSKRGGGSIDNQIDKYNKAMKDQKDLAWKEGKTERDVKEQERKDLKNQATDAFKSLDRSTINKFASIRSKTPAQVRDWLKEMIILNPKTLINYVEQMKAL